jgi:hypothetical protein
LNSYHHVPYIYDYITKLSRKQAEIIHDHENEVVRNIGHGSVNYLQLVEHNLLYRAGTEISFVYIVYTLLQESSIPLTKATSKRGRSPREEPTREAKYQLERMNPTVDDEQENDITENTNMVDWQLVREIKRKKSNKVFKNNNSSEPAVTTNNRYKLLTNEVTNKEEPTDVNTTKRIPRPLPIFVYVINYPQMIQHLAEVAEEENYNTRSMATNIMKINCHSAETYRKILAFMKENIIIYRSYQPKNERPYKKVIKHLHHSVKLEDITDELSGLGHKVRNIINAKHRQTKEPLNLFFIDLEPAEYTLLNCKIIKHKSLIHILINYYKLRMMSDRLSLSSERAPHKGMTATFRQ